MDVDNKELNNYFFEEQDFKLKIKFKTNSEKFNTINLNIIKENQENKLLMNKTKINYLPNLNTKLNLHKNLEFISEFGLRQNIFTHLKYEKEFEDLNFKFDWKNFCDESNKKIFCFGLEKKIDYFFFCNFGIKNILGYNSSFSSFLKIKKEFFFDKRKIFDFEDENEVLQNKNNLINNKIVFDLSLEQNLENQNYNFFFDSKFFYNFNKFGNYQFNINFHNKKKFRPLFNIKYKIEKGLWKMVLFYETDFYFKKSKGFIFQKYRLNNFGSFQMKIDSFLITNISVLLTMGKNLEVLTGFKFDLKNSSDFSYYNFGVGLNLNIF